MSGMDDDDWRPPTEAEQKVLAAKRERSDKISKLMGDYLLKGYKMLATSCRVCGTIELQDRQGKLYCVACMEVDCHETSKDNPVLNTAAADRVIAESAFSSNLEEQIAEGAMLSRSPDVVNSVSEQPTLRAASARVNSRAQTSHLAHRPSPDRAPAGSRQRRESAVQPPSRVSLDSANDSLERSLATVITKLSWATGQLASTDNLDESIKLVELIKHCADTIVAIRKSLKN